MIIKSMSRKVPSFAQLLSYIEREPGQEEFCIRHNLMSRDMDRIRAEFERNGTLLRKRKNGVYLYHEIISITRAKGLSAKEQKDRLYQIAQNYIAARCPDNLVFGGLHQDKDHSYHMHLMISANRAGQQNRLRLSKGQFREIQVQLEAHVLENFPELEQTLAIGKVSDRRLKKGEVELERRTGKRPKREEVLERVQNAFDQSQDRDSFFEALGRYDLELYVRGKNLGVIDHESGKNHRLKTLNPELAEQIKRRMNEVETARSEKSPAGEKEKSTEAYRFGKEAGTNRDQEQTEEQKHTEPELEQEEIDERYIVEDDELSEIQKSWKKSMREEREESAEREKDDPKRER